MARAGVVDASWNVATNAPATVRLFPTLIGIALGISCVVLVEPAPVDALVLALFAFGVVFGIVRLGQMPVLPVLFLAGLALANILSIPASEDPQRGLWYCFVTLYMMISWALFVGVMNSYGVSILKPIFGGYSLGACLSVILAVASYFHMIGFQSSLLLYGRPKGLFKDPNVFGPFLILIAVLAISGYLPFASRFAQWGTAVVASLGIALSYSRACWINYAVSLVLFALLDRLLPSQLAGNRSPSLLRLAGLALLTLLVIVPVLQIPSVKAMLTVRFGQGGMHDYDRLRFQTQRLAVQAAIDHPLGIGPGQSEDTFRYATHSSYIRVLSENGLFGLFCFAGFLLSTLAQAITKACAARSPQWRGIYIAAAACLSGHLINSGVVDTLHWRHLWFLFALPWAQYSVVVAQGTADRFRPLNCQERQT
jgi:hypothetical protein